MAGGGGTHPMLECSHFTDYRDVRITLKWNQSEMTEDSVQ
jgi:hypothetical protein